MFLDFSIVNEKKVLEKFMFINSLNLDWASCKEKLTLDPYGYFLFNYEN